MPELGPGRHLVTLSNGQQLLLEEGENCLSIAAYHNDDVDAYLAQITVDGVLVYCNSGDANDWLVRGLTQRK